MFSLYKLTRFPLLKVNVFPSILLTIVIGVQRSSVFFTNVKRWDIVRNKFFKTVPILPMNILLTCKTSLASEDISRWCLKEPMFGVTVWMIIFKFLTFVESTCSNVIQQFKRWRRDTTFTFLDNRCKLIIFYGLQKRIIGGRFRYRSIGRGSSSSKRYFLWLLNHLIAKKHLHRFRMR